MSLLMLNEDELRQTINLSEALSVIEESFVASGEGRVTIPGSFRLNLPDVGGKVDVKGAYLQDAPYYVIKIGNRFENNPGINLPAHSGFIIVFDAATGFPAALLLDNGYLTNVRAGIAGALATRRLANTPIRTVSVIGTGRQAFIHLKALLTAEMVELVQVWGPAPIKADAFARRIVEDHDVNIELAPSLEAAVSSADVLITALPGQEPLIQGQWLKPGVHITSVVPEGENLPKKLLHNNALARADVIVVDNYPQCAEWGEIHHGLAEQIITPANIQGDLSSLLLGKIPGRKQRDQITLVDLTGLDWQDATIATLALDKALFLGLGQRLDPGLERKQVGQRVENLL